MARTRMVTRTVSGYKVNALLVHLDNNSFEEKELNMGVDYNPEKGLDLVRKMVETDTIIPVQILNTTTFNTLYGMTERKFITWAEKLPPRGEGGRTRTRMITRTITEYKVTVLRLNLATRTFEDFTYQMGVEYDQKKGLDILRKEWESPEYKILSIKSTEKVETLYGMPETKFMQLAEILPPRTGNDDTEIVEADAE